MKNKIFITIIILLSLFIVSILVFLKYYNNRNVQSILLSRHFIEEDSKANLFVDDDILFISYDKDVFYKMKKDNIIHKIEIRNLIGFYYPENGQSKFYVIKNENNQSILQECTFNSDNDKLTYSCKTIWTNNNLDELKAIISTDSLQYNFLNNNYLIINNILKFDINNLEEEVNTFVLNYFKNNYNILGKYTCNFDYIVNDKYSVGWQYRDKTNFYSIKREDFTKNIEINTDQVFKILKDKYDIDSNMRKYFTNYKLLSVDESSNSYFFISEFKRSEDNFQENFIISVNGENKVTNLVRFKNKKILALKKQNNLYYSLINSNNSLNLIISKDFFK